MRANNCLTETADDPIGSRQFLPKQYLDPIPLQQIQLSKGTLEQNPGW